MTNIPKEYTNEQFVKLNEVPVKIGSMTKVTRTVRETLDKVTITVTAVIPKAELMEREIGLSGLDELVEVLGVILKNKNLQPNIQPSTSVPNNKGDE